MPDGVRGVAVRFSIWRLLWGGGEKGVEMGESEVSGRVVGAGDSIGDLGGVERASQSDEDNFLLK